MRKVTHVALLSERVVMVKASLTGPVTHALLLVHTVLLSHSVVKLLIELCSWLILSILSGKLGFSLFVFHLSNVFWLSFIILHVARFLASEAFSSSLEVVVVAHAALPASIWESKFFRVLFLCLFFLFFLLVI